MADELFLHVIAGPNGAGKTSLYEAWIRRETEAEFVNADRLIFEAIGGHALTEADAKLGQQLAEERRAALMAERKSLVTESTFSHPSKVDLVREAQALGYRVVVYHVCVESADLAVARVAERLANGGHPVPEDRIRGRFGRNPDFIREAMLLAEAGFVFDNSVMGEPPRRLITFDLGNALAVANDLPDWASKVYASEIAKFRDYAASEAL